MRRRPSRTHDRAHEARSDPRRSVRGIACATCAGDVADTPMNGHTLTLARYIALREVKAEWRRQGVKLQQFDGHDLAKATKGYLSEHFDELVEQAARHLNETPK